MRKIQVWDVPIRLFHWALVVMIVVCIYTIDIGKVQVHQYAGVFVLILLVFRVIWGLIGSTTARFWDFVKSPVAAYHYLRYGITKTEGHNPLGAYMVLFMLLVLFVQVGTGLFLEDNTYIQDSPLYKFVTAGERKTLLMIHKYNLYVIYAMITVHVTVIFVYLIFRGQNLVKTMIIGNRTEEELHVPLSESVRGNRPWLALMIFIILCVVVPYILFGALKNVEFIVWAEKTALWIKGLLL